MCNSIPFMVLWALLPLSGAEGEDCHKLYFESSPISPKLTIKLYRLKCQCCSWSILKAMEENKGFPCQEITNLNLKIGSRVKKCGSRRVFTTSDIYCLYIH